MHVKDGETVAKNVAQATNLGVAVENYDLGISISQAEDLRKASDDLYADLGSAIANFIAMRPDDLPLIVAFVLATWLPECFQAVPYLWILGPLGSAKTKLLRVLKCICRRAELVADIRAASLYQLVNSEDPPTLLIDEFDGPMSQSHTDILRLLRSGTTKGVPTVRNGQRFRTFGFKAIASRQLPADGALASRVVTIPMLPCERDLWPLDDNAVRQLTAEFQPRLQAFRDKMQPAVLDFQRQPLDLPDMSPRMRDIARVLASTFVGDPQRQAFLLAALAERDAENCADRTLEPEWLVGLVLFKLCHPLPSQPLYPKLTVGFIGAKVTELLRHRGEDGAWTSYKARGALRTLGFRTKKLGNLGRGLELTRPVMWQIHETARHLGIDRRDITNIGAIEAGNGGLPCALCEEAHVTGGLSLREMYPRR